MNDPLPVNVLKSLEGVECVRLKLVLVSDWSQSLYTKECVVSECSKKRGDFLVGLPG